MDPQAAAAIALVPGWRVDEAEASPLGGGITNRSYRAVVRDEVFVLRVGGKGVHALGIDRAHELAVLRIVGALGVGAELVFADVARDVVVTRFIEGVTLDARTASRPDTLGRIAAVARRVHEGPAFPGRFSPLGVVRQYDAAIQARGSVRPAIAEDAVRLALELERALEEPPRLCPCHNDLLPANLIDDGTRVRIIDWEYAAMGDGYFDLGNLATNLSLDPSSAACLLGSYLGRPATRAELERLARHRIASDLREGFWGLMQLGESELEFDFAAYAARHLERAVAAAGTMGP